MTRYLLGATLVIGVTRLLLEIAPGAPGAMEVALQMREHLAREGLIDGVKCMSCAKPDFGGIRYLPKGHKDSFWPHWQKLDAKTRAEMIVPDYLIAGGCRFGPRAESLLEVLARLPAEDDAR